MAGYQVDEPSNDFVEFVQVWSPNGTYPEAITLFKSPRGEFVVQVGYKIDEEQLHNTRHLRILTSAGSVVEIQRKKRGNIERRYRVVNDTGHRLAVTRTYPADYE